MSNTPERYRVMFVDDEQSILDGLRDSLRKQRKQWDMVFALGGPAALELLENAHAHSQCYDVVVSDMRMPGVDGAAVLAKVKQLFPACARIILSGHAERESVVKSLPVAHQFLSKPCDGELLRTVVGRACELQRLLMHEGIRGAVGKLDKLPSVPETYWQLTQAAARTGVTIAELAGIIERDPAMSVKVLQLVNSSYFGVAQRLSSVQQAVSYLGIDLVKSLALSAHAFGISAGKVARELSLERLQRNSLMTAHLAKRIVADPQAAGEAFTASMIHDVGKIILAQGMPDAYDAVLREARASGRPDHVVELEQLGLTHAEVGAFLLGSWGLPLSVVEAVAFHHTPHQVQGTELAVLAAVHAADALIESALSAGGGSAPSTQLDVAFLERLSLTDQLPHWRALAEEAVGANRSS